MKTPAKHSVVIYDAQTGQALRVIVPDYQEQLDDPAMVAPNEKFILIPKTDYEKMDQQQMFDHIMLATQAAQIEDKPKEAKSPVLKE